MKIPLKAPSAKEATKKLMEKPSLLTFAPPLAYLTDNKKSILPKEYIHWDKLIHLKAPEKLSVKEWWYLIKFSRFNLYKQLPFTDSYGNPFQLALVDTIWQKLNQIDRKAGYTVPNNSPLIETQIRHNYLSRSLIEEAVTSSQLEGASTTTEVAKTMLQQGRKPKNHSEKMIFNNHQAMQFIREIKSDTLTPELILELHRILTEDTLVNPKKAGKLRIQQDDIHVVDHQSGQILHTPPNSVELKKRLSILCNFANKQENEFFIHPVIKAILLHFILAYDHPFVDGNGRTARALFYWSMANQNYWLMEYISISSIIKKAPIQYAKAFLYTETDDNDVTYFVNHQLDTIVAAVTTLENYVTHKRNELNKAKQLLFSNNKLREKLNYRQLALIEHALKNPQTLYYIETHKNSHNVTYDTARNDLLKLTKLGLLIKEKLGKAFVFTAIKNLEKKLNFS